MKYIRTKQTAIRGLFFLVAPIFALTVPLLFLAPTGRNILIAVFLLPFVFLLSIQHLRVRAIEITPSVIIVTRGYRRKVPDIIQSCDISQISGIPLGGWRIKKSDGKEIGIGLMCFSRTDREAIAQQFMTVLVNEKKRTSRRR